MMGYYNEPVSRTDKDGEKRNYRPNFDEEIKKAERAGNHQMRTDAFAEGDGYLCVDDLDRIRRDMLKHQTK
jgi:hypothetical protein